MQVDPMCGGGSLLAGSAIPTFSATRGDMSSVRCGMMLGGDIESRLLPLCKENLEGQKHTGGTSKAVGQHPGGANKAVAAVGACVWTFVALILFFLTKHNWSIFLFVHAIMC